MFRPQTFLLLGNFYFLFQAPSGPSVALPAGWEERQDANGRTYYVNHIGEPLWKTGLRCDLINFQREQHSGNTLVSEQTLEGEGKRGGIGT